MTRTWKAKALGVVLLLACLAVYVLTSCKEEEWFARLLKPHVVADPFRC